MKLFLNPGIGWLRKPRSWPEKIQTVLIYRNFKFLDSEGVMTFMFLIIILGATNERAPKGFAGIAIGLGLTLIHLISIPVTNTSVNPAKSISHAIFVGD